MEGLQEVGSPLESRIPVDEGEGVFPGRLENREVLHRIPDPQPGQAVLPDPEELPRSPDPEILGGDCEAVIGPLGMSSTELRGSPAYDIWSNVDDLARLAQELLRPTLVAEQTLDVATTVHFPELRGVVPGFGSFDPNPWGLGMEIRGDKQPHWTAPESSPQTFGHFGGSGTYLWVDPQIDLAAVAIAGTEYGPWANEAWPATNAAIVERYAPPSRK